MPNAPLSEAHYPPLISQETWLSFTPSTFLPGWGWLQRFARQKPPSLSSFSSLPVVAFAPWSATSLCVSFTCPLDGTSQAPRGIRTDQSVFVCFHWRRYLRDRQAVNDVGECLLTQRQIAQLWMVHRHVKQIATTPKCLEIRSCVEVNRRRTTESRADWINTDVHTGYHPARAERRPTHFSAKARCTRHPDGQRCPSQSWLPGTVSRERKNKQRVSDMCKNLSQRHLFKSINPPF